MRDPVNHFNPMNPGQIRVLMRESKWGWGVNEFQNTRINSGANESRGGSSYSPE
jgi:hypothetical protein